MRIIYTGDDSVLNKLRRPEMAAQLFSGWDDIMVWSALQGIMGNVYVNEAFTSAAIQSGDFCFFSGEPDRELTELLVGRPYSIAVPGSEKWKTMIKLVHGTHASERMRYAIKKEPDIFSEDHLKALTTSIQQEYALRLMDEELYQACMKEDWCRDLVSQYPTYGDFFRLGLGVVALKDGKIVSGASSYCTYRDGIEIEIDTHCAYRRRGLAAACAAALILECLKLGLYPSWDAHNLGSVSLAEKLGYHFSHEYLVYEIVY